MVSEHGCKRKLSEASFPYRQREDRDAARDELEKYLSLVRRQILGYKKNLAPSHLISGMLTVQF